VIADLTNGTNNIYFYAERAHGKDGNALCSLRMAYHLTKLESTTISLELLDYCVEQNKSNSIMMFCAMLSLIFYKKVVCLYLMPGHSHMIADRVVVWMKILFKESKCFIHLSLWNHVIRSTLLMHVSWILLEMIAIFSLDGTACWQNTSRNFHLDSHMVTFLSLKMFQSLINTFVKVRTKKQLTSNVQYLKPNRHRECHCFGAFGFCGSIRMVNENTVTC
jgi:hypothetical protein